MPKRARRDRSLDLVAPLQHHAQPTVVAAACGAAAMRSTTSFCSITCWSTRCGAAAQQVKQDRRRDVVAAGCPPRSRRPASRAGPRAGEIHLQHVGLQQFHARALCARRQPGRDRARSGSGARRWPAARLGQRARARVDFDDALARPRVDRAHDRVDHAGIDKEVLTEALARQAGSASRSRTGVRGWRTCATRCAIIVAAARASRCEARARRSLPHSWYADSNFCSRSVARSLVANFAWRSTRISRRSITWIKCTPNAIPPGARQRPGRSPFIASSNSGTKMPGDVQPRSPPAGAERGLPTLRGPPSSKRRCPCFDLPLQIHQAASASRTLACAERAQQDVARPASAARAPPGHRGARAPSRDESHRCCGTARR